MSFSANLKQELCAIEVERDCCQRAESYGMLLFGRHFNKSRIGLLTDHPFLAERYAGDLYQLAGFHPEVLTVPSGKIRVDVTDPDRVMQVLHELGYAGTEAVFGFLESDLENACCAAAFLRGVFLVCGVMSDPASAYHLEFSVGSPKKAQILQDRLRDAGFSSKTSQRKGSVIVYMKVASDLFDFLAYIGAQHSALTLVDEEMIRNVRNNVNRKFNCENANMKKTARSAGRQVEAIRRLQAEGRLQRLTQGEQELARLRVENPEMTLQELGAALSQPMSRAGVYHRLNKILKMSERED